MTEAARNGLGKFARKPFCIVCGKPRGNYRHDSSGRARAVCSRACNAAYSKNLRDTGRIKIKPYVKKPPKLPTINGNCAYCGAHFLTHYPSKKYCSGRCNSFYDYKILGIGHYTPVIKQTRLCAYCGKDFVGKANARFCCNRCHRAANARAHRQKYRRHDRIAALALKQLIGKDKANTLIRNLMKTRRVPRLNGSDVNVMAARILKQLIGKGNVNAIFRSVIESH